MAADNTNGHSNGRSNGHSNGHANGHASSGASRAPEPVTAWIRFVTYILEEHRGKINFFIVLPISFLCDVVWSWRDWYYETFCTTPHLHGQRVAEVQRQVREWRARKDAGEEVGKMCTDRKPFLTMGPATRTFKKECRKIKCSDMCDILKVDHEAMTVTCEPLVNMGHITRALLPMGYALKIQIEMEDLTIGGLSMGLGMETNSHRFGLIQETIRAYDVVLASGELVHCTRDNEHAALFGVMAWSCGTLGFLVAVEVEIVKVKPYVRATYLPCFTLQEHCAEMKRLSLLPEGQTPPYLESTVYGKDRAVIQCIEFVDISWREWLFEVNSCNLWFKPYYYKWVEGAFERTNRATGKPGFSEILPIKHYYHRYTRSIFWELNDLIPFGNNPLYRYLFGWLGAPKIAFIKLFMTTAIRESVVTKHVVQDIVVPIDSMQDGLKLFHEQFNIYPLLVFPIRIYDHGDKQGFLRRPRTIDGVDGPDGQHPGKAWGMYVDLGAYGVPQAVRDKQPWDFEKALLHMESWTRAHGGYQCFYTDFLLTRDEYKEMFDHTLYDKMRKLTGADIAFPEVYDKVRPELKVCDRNGRVKTKAH
ncbi:hypothetical protein KFE25_011936 [Diacronema lutheri]|uniref:Delta(24)-sterol reductase n=1 Tax=Diacronema lutheri TaxID=2081491 RepID=A0A8J5XAY4_DIALT|nr:hypothetical protein KFE25_011936 [Diacronema lutheri]